VARWPQGRDPAAAGLGPALRPAAVAAVGAGRLYAGEGGDRPGRDPAVRSDVRLLRARHPDHAGDRGAETDRAAEARRRGADPGPRSAAAAPAGRGDAARPWRLRSGG